MSFDVDGIELAEKILPYWRQPKTIAFFIAVVAVLGTVCFMVLDVKQISNTELIIVALFCLIIFSVWFYSTRLPKAPLNCIGLAIALSAETKEQQKRLNADLIASLKTTLSHGTDYYHFKVIEIPRERSLLIQSIEDATRMRLKTRCKFLLWGTAKLRDINDASTHVINLNIQIGHNPIPTAVSNSFSREISAIYPGKLHLAQKNDLMALEFTSDWLDLVTRYVVGVSLAFSGFVDAAEATFADLCQDARLRNASLTQIRKLKSLNCQRLAHIYEWRASQHYEAWRETRSPKNLEDMSCHIENLRSILPNSYPGRLLAAIYQFASNRNVKKALAEINKCTDQDPTWRYSLAFLHAYKGEMAKARRVYRSAFERSCNRNDVPIQTEEFMLWVLSEEPEKAQLHFCLGLVNWHAKNDLEQAAKDFQNFLDAGLESKFPEEFKLANLYIGTLKGEIAAAKRKQLMTPARKSETTLSDRKQT
ncbi:MAG: hypothetical protein WCK89_06940 [bacterium]